MVRNRQPQELYQQLRRHMIRETEEFLEASLRQPNHQVRIPTIEVGRGRFTPRFAREFWQEMLGLSPEPDSWIGRLLYRSWPVRPKRTDPTPRPRF
ncbi:MAG: hypothetical protein GY778_08915 [bacterium]|nr:hypothetical protein [bacterium]